MPKKVNSNRDSITIPLTINKYKDRKLYDYLQRIKQGQKSFAMRELIEAGMETDHRYSFVDKLIDENYEPAEPAEPDQPEEKIDLITNENFTRVDSYKDIPIQSTKKRKTDKNDILKNVKVFKDDNK